MQDKRQLFAYISAAFLAFGTLVPLVSLPIVGTINYLGSLSMGAQSTTVGDGVFILVFAGVAVLLTVLKKYKWLLLPGIAAAVLSSVTLIGLIAKINEMRAQLDADLEGNPFAGLATGLLSSVQIQWGWVVLYLGAAGLILVALGILPRPAKVAPAESTEELKPE